MFYVIQCVNVCVKCIEKTMWLCGNPHLTGGGVVGGVVQVFCSTVVLAVVVVWGCGRG